MQLYKVVERIAVILTADPPEGKYYYRVESDSVISNNALKSYQAAAVNCLLHSLLHTYLHFQLTAVEHKPWQVYLLCICKKYGL